MGLVALVPVGSYGLVVTFSMQTDDCGYHLQ
ncbi:hypothetical protein predicted by Glimmer/Critica [Lactiplantibacillus plantarum]|nr:hypothetical protein predicted by Glimmer/Critica [Lactiplantibacillus plantarum]